MTPSFVSQLTNNIPPRWDTCSATIGVSRVIVVDPFADEAARRFWAQYGTRRQCAEPHTWSVEEQFWIKVMLWINVGQTFWDAAAGCKHPGEEYLVASRRRRGGSGDHVYPKSRFSLFTQSDTSSARANGKGIDHTNASFTISLPSKVSPFPSSIRR